MPLMEQNIKECVEESNSRGDLWIQLVKLCKVNAMVEVGVFRGDFAKILLEKCETITKYYMVDPWRHLDDWNKPANTSDEVFEQYLSETKAKTDFAAQRRIILRGKTTEAMANIADGELDFAYIDGDHTLKGIAIDLIQIYPKIRTGGWIGGDDFSRTIWQHGAGFEPTLVFPFAIYFAEAVGALIYALPYGQFLIEKRGFQSYSFIDLTGHYKDTGLRQQFKIREQCRARLMDTFLRAQMFAAKLRQRGSS